MGDGGHDVLGHELETANALARPMRFDRHGPLSKSAQCNAQARGNSAARVDGSWSGSVSGFLRS